MAGRLPGRRRFPVPSGRRRRRARTSGCRAGAPGHPSSARGRASPAGARRTAGTPGTAPAEVIHSRERNGASQGEARTRGRCGGTPAERAKLFLAEVAAILRVGSDQLDPDRDLTSQGLDSLMAAQLRQEVQRTHGVLLPIGKILSRVTLSDLADELGAVE